MYRNIFFKKKFVYYALGPVFWGRIMPSKYSQIYLNYLENDYIPEDRFKEVQIEKPKYKKYNDTDFSFLFKNMGMALSTFMFYLIVFKNKKAKCQGTSKPYLGCSLRSKDDGMQIVMVKSDSPAEKGGLQAKDIILEIDGMKVSSINEYNAAVGSEANMKKLKIIRTLDNRETILYVEVHFVNL
jgi:C-terminal processing protease CtpA/Prc